MFSGKSRRGEVVQVSLSRWSRLLSSALALCSAPGLHNSFHKYLLHNMTRCQKRPRAARISPEKTIITHLRVFFFPPVTIAIIFWYLGVTRRLSKALEIASGRILPGAEQVRGGEGGRASCRSRALDGFKPRNLPPRGLGKLFMHVSSPPLKWLTQL